MGLLKKLWKGVKKVVKKVGKGIKKVVGKIVTIRARQMTFDRETSIIVTGQLSGSVYVIRIQVGYDDQRT